MGDRSNKTRYYLIACGTSNYKHLGNDEQLSSIQTDIERVVELFTQNFGYVQVLRDLQLNPKANALTEQFADWLQNKERCETDCLVFYYTGHGEYVQGDRHYLLMEETNPKKIGQTALPTEDLVRPLKNEGVKIAQILYIIDTCYSQSGAGDVVSFASKVIQQFQPVKGANIAVHSIAACRAKQTAQEGLFSQALEEILKKDEFQRGYIHPIDLVEKINRKIASDTQHVVYNVVGSETSPKFLPVLPKNLQTWEEKRNDFIEQLLRTLKEQFNDSLLCINSFLLSSKFIEEFVLDELDLKYKLRDLAIKPVSDGICPLIACSEWCRLRFSDRDQQKSNLTLAQKIENWQNEVFQYRKEVNVAKTKEIVKRLRDEFTTKIQKENLRIQIEIEPQIDKQENTGLQTGLFIFNMNLWIESQKLPFGRFAENIVLDPQGIEGSRLQMCLEKEDFLSHLIRKARYSLTDSVKPTIEIFLPFVFYQEFLETICFKSGRVKKELGKEYRIFINSFERYFDEDFREIRDEIYEKKKALWNNDLNLDSETYYIGTNPSTSELEMIEQALPIAVWSRNDQKPLVEGEEGQIKISEWKDWPDKIHHLRKHNQDLEITLFWDDLYPKPSRRCRPLNTKVVE